MCATDPGVRIMPCPCCGGDGGWSEPVSMNPFTGSIREQDIPCRYCDGNGESEIEFLPITLEDLDALDAAMTF